MNGRLVDMTNCSRLAGTPPVVSQLCTTASTPISGGGLPSTPPSITTYVYKTGDWGVCQPDNTQSRSVQCINQTTQLSVDLGSCGTIGGIVPGIIQSCTYIPSSTSGTQGTTSGGSTSTPSTTSGTTTSGTSTPSTTGSTTSGGTTTPTTSGGTSTSTSTSTPTTTGGTTSGGTSTLPSVTYTYITGAWNSCINNQQSRGVMCVDSFNNVQSMDKCKAPAPSTTQTCVSPVVKADWVIGSWNPCINNQQNRSVVCKDINGITVPIKYCTKQTPISVQSCQPVTSNNKVWFAVGAIFLFVIVWYLNKRFSKKKDASGLLSKIKL